MVLLWEDSHDLGYNHVKAKTDQGNCDWFCHLFSKPTWRGLFLHTSRNTDCFPPTFSLSQGREVVKRSQSAHWVFHQETKRPDSTPAVASPEIPRDVFYCSSVTSVETFEPPTSLHHLPAGAPTDDKLLPPLQLFIGHLHYFDNFIDNQKEKEPRAPSCSCFPSPSIPKGFADAAAAA